ncbi:MAG: thioredoxin family protein [Gammaproteobacteria bacterium]
MRIRRFLFLPLVALWLIAGSGAAMADDIRPPSEYFFQDTFGNFKDELQTAREQGKTGIMLFFEQADCPFCHRMKQTVLNRKSVQDYYRKHFLIFSVDIKGSQQITDFQGREETEKDFAFKKNGVRATPVFAFYNLKGDRIVRYTGITSNAQEFLWLGQYVVDGIYKNESFTKYKRQKRRDTNAL